MTDHTHISDDTLRYKGNWLAMHELRGYEFVTRIRGCGAAIIIAVTQKRELLLVEQFRMAVHASVLELPAGLVGDDIKDEAVKDAARRELLEETGYEADTMRIVAQGPISSGLSAESMTFCLAGRLTKRHEGGGVDDEDIIVHRIPLDDIDSTITAFMDRGLLIDPKIYMALYFAQNIGSVTHNKGAS